jgi:hypothetical protein
MNEAGGSPSLGPKVLSAQHERERPLWAILEAELTESFLTGW